MGKILIWILSNIWPISGIQEDRVFENQTLIKLPIVRNGKLATVVLPGDVGNLEMIFLILRVF